MLGTGDAKDNSVNCKSQANNMITQKTGFGCNTKTGSDARTPREVSVKPQVMALPVKSHRIKHSMTVGSERKRGPMVVKPSSENKELSSTQNSSAEPVDTLSQIPRRRSATPPRPVSPLRQPIIGKHRSVTPPRQLLIGRNCSVTPPGHSSLPRRRSVTPSREPNFAELLGGTSQNTSVSCHTRSSSSVEKRRSPIKSRPSSPVFRPPSPCKDGSTISEEAMLRQIQRAQKARLYLLSQTGPNSFLIGGDLPEHKYRVVIGPQQCSCNVKGPFCVHILFVMLRVFKLHESNSLLWNKPLKNFEVESLLQSYLDRREKQAKSKQGNGIGDSANVRSKCANESVHTEQKSSDDGEAAQKLSCEDDEEICPICLLEMSDGESLVICAAGCLNRLHQHCFVIWAEECQGKNEAVICPLCRGKWDGGCYERGHTHPEPFLARKETLLPQAGPLLDAHRTKAQAWIPVFGERLIACLFQKDWTVREAGLRRLTSDISKSPLSVEKVSVCCEIIASLLSDPVYRVYVATLKLLRSLLGHVIYSEQLCQSTFQEMLRPVVTGIISKCADAIKRTSMLSLATIVELCRGATGELAVGKMIDNNAAGGIGGAAFVISCITQQSDASVTQWQHLLGSLVATETIMCRIYGEFETDERLSIPPQMLNDIMTFAVKLLDNPHSSVNRYARQVCLLVTKHNVPSSAAIDSSLQQQNSSKALCEALSNAHVVEKLRPSPLTTSSESSQTVKDTCKEALTANIKNEAGDCCSSLALKKLDIHNELPKYARTESDVTSGLGSSPDSDISLKDVLSSPSRRAPTYCTDSGCETSVVVTEVSSPSVILPDIPKWVEGKELIACKNQQHDDCDCTISYMEGVHWMRGVRLGTGSYSSCYKARDVRTGMLMAVKRLSFSRDSAHEQEKAVNAIQFEVKTMVQLQHPHVVRILGATQHLSHVNLFVEWMAGGSVACLLAEYGPFTETVIYNYTQQILLGLAYLHDNQLLHRDLKGANLLVDSTGHVLKIGDFGVAAHLMATVTQSREFEKQTVGTWAFTAPEVLRGESYGRSCDIWSTGCCVIEMCSGEPPWGATSCSNHFQLWWKIGNANGPPPLPCGMSPLLQDLALKCLNLSPKERFTAQELLLHPAFHHQAKETSLQTVKQQ